MSITWYTPTLEQLEAWEAWKLDPEHAAVRAIAERFNPWTLYKLATTGQRCSVIGFDEYEGTEHPVRLKIHAENPTLGTISARNVFGILPDDLVEWTEADEPDGPKLESSFDARDISENVP